MAGGKMNGISKYTRTFISFLSEAFRIHSYRKYRNFEQQPNQVLVRDILSWKFHFSGDFKYDIEENTNGFLGEALDTFVKKLADMSPRKMSSLLHTTIKVNRKEYLIAGAPDVALIFPDATIYLAELKYKDTIKDFHKYQLACYMWIASRQYPNTIHGAVVAMKGWNLKIWELDYVNFLEEWKEQIERDIYSFILQKQFEEVLKNE